MYAIHINLFVIALGSLLVRSSCAQSLTESRRLGIWDVIDNLVDIEELKAPSSSPTQSSSAVPTALPTFQPSIIPSIRPSTHHSFSPSSQPSTKPTSQPTISPSLSPSEFQSIPPTQFPSLSPTATPSSYPSVLGSQIPTFDPSNVPSLLPTTLHSATPSRSTSPSAEDTGTKLTSYLIKINISISGLDNQMNREEVETLKETTYGFVTECASGKLPDSEIKTISIDVRSQKLGTSFLDVGLIISGMTSSNDPDIVKNMLTNCFKSQNEDFIQRINTSLAPSEMGYKNNDYFTFNKMALIFLCSGIGVAVLALGAAGVLLINNRKRNKHKSNLHSLYYGDKNDFGLACEPKIRSFSPNELNELKGASTFGASKTNTPSPYLPKTNADLDLHIDVTPDMYPEAIDVPQVPQVSRNILTEAICGIPMRIQETTNDEIISKNTAISSITDINQYSNEWRQRISKNPNPNPFDIPPLFDAESQPEINARQVPSPFPSSRPNSNASSGIMMGLNIPMETALAARRIPYQFFSAAREASPPSKYNSKQQTQGGFGEDMMKVLDDLCLVDSKKKTNIKENL